MPSSPKPAALSDLRRDIDNSAYNGVFLNIENALNKKQPLIANRLVQDLERRFSNDDELAEQDIEKIGEYLKNARGQADALTAVGLTQGVDVKRLTMQTGWKVI